MNPISGPISGDIRSIPRRRPSSSPYSAPSQARDARLVPVRVDRPASTQQSVDGDVEVEIRLFADGRSITVRRTVAPGPDGEMTTVGIDALVR